MARPRARARAHSKHRMAKGSAMTNRQAVSGGQNASAVPRVLLRAVDSVEVVAAGALQVARDVLVGAVSGAANIGAEALTATFAGAGAIVSAAAQTVADIVETAQDTVLATIDDAKHSRRGSTRLAPRRAAASMAGGPDGKVTSLPSPGASRASRRVKRPRLVTRTAPASAVA